MSVCLGLVLVCLVAPSFLPEGNYDTEAAGLGQPKEQVNNKKNVQKASGTMTEQLVWL